MGPRFTMLETSWISIREFYIHYCTIGHWTGWAAFWVFPFLSVNTYIIYFKDYKALKELQFGRIKVTTSSPPPIPRMIHENSSAVF